VYAIHQRDLLSGIIGSLFLFQAVTNTGCCGANGCSTSIPKKEILETERIVFEEVK